MSVDLSQMTRKELLQLQEDVAVALKEAEQRELSEAMKAVEQAAAQYGYSLDEVLGSSQKTQTSKKSKAAPKYRNPDDHSETWTGRGRKPYWVHKALTDGVDISALEI
ncbi:MAG: H-NS histone family protein [Epibacterium sp.]|nr:H-NS histone family protein [Epibacterium sp.]NQX73017.1 H-NS histone family protein [Epibacterium sp.]